MKISIIGVLITYKINEKRNDERNYVAVKRFSQQ